MKIGRRALGQAILAALAGACGGTKRTAPVSGPTDAVPPRNPFLWGCFDFPDDPRTAELSGISWEDSTRTLWAVQDETPHIVPLRPDRDLGRWSVGAPIAIDAPYPLDLEGIVVLPDGFLLASEAGPRILEVDRNGKLRRELPLPDHFALARANKSLESLTMTEDGTFLYTTSEDALGCDGHMPTMAAGTALRIVRVTRRTGRIDERAYRTDPKPTPDGDYGVADLAALNDGELLVLERGWAPNFGNTARIYRVTFSESSASCLATPSLDETSPVLQKNLFVDLKTLPTNGLPSVRQVQSSALLDNFEGLALGPRTRDGRKTLFLVSDNNGRRDQFARLVTLSFD